MSHQESIDQGANGKEGGLAVTHDGWVRGSTQEHTKGIHTETGGQKTVSSTLRRVKIGSGETHQTQVEGPRAQNVSKVIETTTMSLD